MGDLGSYVVIEHSVYGEKFYSIYAHLDEAFTDMLGAQVDAGTQIGTMGLTPVDAGFEDHLHFEIRTALHVNVSEDGDVTLPTGHTSYWIESPSDQKKWVDLSASELFD